MINDDIYMLRCFQLARLGIGQTGTNPIVGSVIVHEGKIIGEGYHQAYGGDHGEIRALQSVTPSHQHLISNSTLYVNLEPCSYHGKTPPCADEIIRRGIRKVVIGCTDPNPKVSGSGILRLRHHGVEVILSDLEHEAKGLNKVFFTNMTTTLPYVILKFAQSRDHFIGDSRHQVAISNTWSQYVVHKIRHEVDGLLIGTNTAVIDNPLLTNRLYYGKNPIRIVWDRQGRIPKDYQLFTDGSPTWLYTEVLTEDLADSVKIQPWQDDITHFLIDLLIQGIGSVLVEGGAMTLQSFIAQGHWDEIWCTQSQSDLGHGVQAPSFKGKLMHHFELNGDQLSVYTR